MKMLLFSSGDESSHDAEVTPRQLEENEEYDMDMGDDSSDGDLRGGGIFLLSSSDSDADDFDPDSSLAPVRSRGPFLRRKSSTILADVDERDQSRLGEWYRMLAFCKYQDLIELLMIFATKPLPDYCPEKTSLHHSESRVHWLHPFERDEVILNKEKLSMQLTDYECCRWVAPPWDGYRKRERTPLRLRRDQLSDVARTLARHDDTTAPVDGDGQPAFFPKARRRVSFVDVCLFAPALPNTVFVDDSRTSHLCRYRTTSRRPRQSCARD